MLHHLHACAAPAVLLATSALQLVCAAAALCAAYVAYVLCRPSSYPGVPVPPLSAYLPGGAAAPVPLDVNALLSTVTFRVILHIAFGASLPLARRVAFAHVMERFIAELLREAMRQPYRRLLASLRARAALWRHKAAIDAVIAELLARRRGEKGDARAARRPDLLESKFIFDFTNIGPQAVVIVIVIYKMIYFY